MTAKATTRPGPPHISGASGLGASTQVLEDLGFDRIRAHEDTLVRAMDDCLRMVLSNVSGWLGLLSRSCLRAALTVCAR